MNDGYIFHTLQLEINKRYLIRDRNIWLHIDLLFRVFFNNSEYLDHCSRRLSNHLDWYLFPIIFDNMDACEYHETVKWVCCSSPNQCRIIQYLRTEQFHTIELVDVASHWHCSILMLSLYFLVEYLMKRVHHWTDLNYFYCCGSRIRRKRVPTNRFSPRI